MPKVFIDGQAGTTGLQIHRALAERSDIELLQIDERRRKDPGARQELLNSADLVLLCLPDDAAREAVRLVESEHVKIIDASTAHRVSTGWTYGLPELCPEQRAAIAASNRVANTGCYAAGFLLLVAPLVSAAMLPGDSQLSVNALSGYSGGGRSLIEKYEAHGGGDVLAPRPYALGLDHKHLPEMLRYSGLEKMPLFTPVVGHYYQGMLVEVPLFNSQIADGYDAGDLLDCLAERYRQEPCVHVHPRNEAAVLVDGYLDPEANNGTNRVDLLLYENEERMVLIARLDNLGKGASGAAVQNLNLMLGCDELAGIAL